MNRMFGTDGIRGKANLFPMDASTALSVGRAVGQYFLKITGKSHVVIGQDTRISSDMLTHAVAAGICSAGLDVCLLGVIPTPGVAYLVVATSAAAGIVISASHNPYDDNGIKIFNSKGYKLSEKEEIQLEALIRANHGPSVAPSAIGRLNIYDNATLDYIQFLKRVLPDSSLHGTTIAVDCANGATAQIAPKLFRDLGAEVISVACAPDGLNINEDCGSQHPDHLARMVRDHRADFGMAFDGDGDRMIAVAENGSVLSGDQLMVIYAHELLKKGQLKNNKVITTVMSNLGFHLAMKQLKIETAVTDVGDRNVMARMILEDAILGGEDSGHIIFRDVHTTGDGIVAGLRLIAALKSSGKALSELSKLMTLFPQCLVNIAVRQKPDLSLIPNLKETVDKIESLLGSQGRVLVRYSGTQNICRVMVEAQTRQLTERYCHEIAEVVRQAIGG